MYSRSDRDQASMEAVQSLRDSAGADSTSIPCSFKPSMAAIIGLLATVLSITFFLLVYARHCKKLSRRIARGFGSSDLEDDLIQLAAARAAITETGIPERVVQALPTFSFSTLLGCKEGLECAVCLAIYEDDEMLRLLPTCKHAFHVECIDEWLRNRSSCPICRRVLSAEEVQQNLGIMTSGKRVTSIEGAAGFHVIDIKDIEDTTSSPAVDHHHRRDCVQEKATDVGGRTLRRTLSDTTGLRIKASTSSPLYKYLNF